MRVRRGPRRGLGLVETIAVVGAVAALSTLAAVPREREVTISAGEVPDGGPIANPGTDGDPLTPTPAGETPGRIPGADVPGLECKAGRNGGATDVGVTGESIRLGSTVVDTGIGAAFLSDVRYGMLAVLNKVNAAGGICGRRLELILRDDGWDAQRGKLFIENLVEGEKVFALAVVPSSEGLRAADSYIQAQGVPVVGTDGMLISQYTNPMIWPVAASTITQVHAMAKDAWQRGRRNFAMVYDSNFRFGVEGAFAFNEAHRRLTEASGGTARDIPGFSDPLAKPRCSGRFCGVKAGQPSYQTQLEVVRTACGQAPECDYVVYLMEPETALTWMRGGGLQAIGREIAAPQPLFNRSFAINCSQRCHNMWVWTGFAPPVGRFANDPAVAEYVSDLRATKAQADASNSFVEGGYIGMLQLVEGLRRLGPNVTRAGLVAALDSMTLRSGFSRPLQWRAGHHFANGCVMAFSIQSRPTFAGWRQESGWKCDPWLGEDIPPDEF